MTISAEEARMKALFEFTPEEEEEIEFIVKHCDEEIQKQIKIGEQEYYGIRASNRRVALKVKDHYLLYGYKVDVSSDYGININW